MTYWVSLEPKKDKHTWICSVCRIHYPVLQSFMAYTRVCNTLNTTGATSEEGIDTLPEHMDSNQVLNGVHVAQSLVFFAVFVLLYFFILSLYYPSYDLQLLITPLVSSNFLDHTDTISQNGQVMNFRKTQRFRYNIIDRVNVEAHRHMARNYLCRSP